MSCYCFITARKNSKGIPNKNMKVLGDKPLIAYSMEAALNSGSFSKVILSTDDEGIIDFAQENYPEVEIPYKRPDALATDESSQTDVVLDLLNHYANENATPEHFVLFQPTSPFRTSEEIQQGVDYLKNGADSVLGICEVWHHPAEYVSINQENKLDFLIESEADKRRQEHKPYYFINGAFYGTSTDRFLKEKNWFNAGSQPLVMGKNTLIDIDTPFDLNLAKGLL